MPSITKLNAGTQDDTATSREITWVDIDTSDEQDRNWLLTQSGVGSGS